MRGPRTPIPVSLRPDERWSLDFVTGTFGASRKFRMLTVNNDCCRENLCLMADTSISGARVARELDVLAGMLFHSNSSKIIAHPVIPDQPSGEAIPQKLGARRQGVGNNCLNVSSPAQDVSPSRVRTH